MTRPLPYGCTSRNTVCLFYRGPLSQWWYSPFEVDGVTYNCAEQFMMAKKAELFGDLATLDAIMLTTGPFQSQKEWNQYPRQQQLLGRAVQNFSQDVWERNRFDIVVTGNRAKFAQHRDLATRLKSTAPLQLAEASPIDRVWGIGLSQNEDAAFNPSNWKGLNLLGNALMAVRNEL